MSQPQSPEETQASAPEHSSVEESDSQSNSPETAAVSKSDEPGPPESAPAERAEESSSKTAPETIKEAKSAAESEDAAPAEERNAKQDSAAAKEPPPSRDKSSAPEKGNEADSGESTPNEKQARDGDRSRSNGPDGERRGKRRRNPRSRNRRRGDDSEGGGNENAEAGEDSDGQPRKTRKQRYLERKEKERAKEAAALEAAEPVESEGLVEISPKGFGFLRERIRGFQQSPKDVFITPETVRMYGLRDGLWVKSISKQGVRGPQLIELKEINGRQPEEYTNLPYFEELTAINPDKKLTLETNSGRFTTRVIDMMTPIGRGQRGLIVAPPRTGKTTLLHHIAEGLIENYDDELHLMILLVDERPEEVTDFERSFPDVEVFSSSNDSNASDHTRIALLAIERAKRLVEAGEHVFILMDSITRLARAFNSQMRGGSKRGTASGGITVGALEVPRRIFAAARNTREAGSLTIIATALIQTNSKADEAIFQEFKGTGNLELVLDRQLAQNYVYPAVDIHKSGTRREELLLAPHILDKTHVIRRGLSGYKPLDAMQWLLRCLERYPSNAQMLMDIKTTALS